MSIRKKFTFDDPEDSYWNESDSNSSSLFDDLQTKQLQARAAVDNLFGGDETPKPFVRPVSTQNSQQNATQSGGLKNDGNVRLTTSSPRASGKLVDDFLNMKFSGNEIHHDRIQSAPSVVSEASASSLPSEAQRLDLDYSRLKAEHRKLQQHLETVRHDRYRTISVDKAVLRMIGGNEVSLDLYRSLREKKSLLDCAVSTYDDNTIFKVVLFLERTLKENIFFKIMDGQKDACRVYVRSLQILGHFEKMRTFLRGVGKHQYASIIEFEATRKYKKTPDKRTPILRTMLHGSFSIPEMRLEAKQIEALLRNYELQLMIEKNDAGEKGENFSKFPKSCSIIGLPSFSTLYYSIMYHFDDPLTSSISPAAVKQLIRFNDRLVMQTTVSVLTRQSRWPDIDKVLQPKPLAMTITAARSVFKGKKVSSKWSVPINSHNLLTIIKRSHHSPPNDFIYRVLRGESDAQERLRLAILFDVPEMVIECMTQKCDRAALTAYSKTLKPNSVESFKAIAALNNTAIKWK